MDTILNIQAGFSNVGRLDAYDEFAERSGNSGGVDGLSSTQNSQSDSLKADLQYEGKRRPCEAIWILKLSITGPPVIEALCVWSFLRTISELPPRQAVAR